MNVERLMMIFKIVLHILRLWVNNNLLLTFVWLSMKAVLSSVVFIIVINLNYCWPRPLQTWTIRKYFCVYFAVLNYLNVDVSERNAKENLQWVE